MTVDDAKRAVELAEKRATINRAAGAIRLSDDELFFGMRSARKWRNPSDRAPDAELIVEKLADGFRDLVAAEAKAQIEAIDNELRALGVTPDPFEDAAPLDLPKDPLKESVEGAIKVFAKARL